jgi:hypothetical protein
MNAETTLSRISKDEVEWVRQRAYYDYMSNMASAKDHGALSAKIEATKNLLKMKLGTIEQIAQAIELSVKDVEKLASEL